MSLATPGFAIGSAAFGLVTADGNVGFLSQQWYAPVHVNPATAIPTAANQFQGSIMWVWQKRAFDAMMLYVDGAVAASSVKTSVYLTTTGGPAAKIPGSDVTLSTAAIGPVIGTFAAPITIPRGWVWPSGVASANPTLRGISGADSSQAGIWGSLDPVRQLSAAANVTSKSGTTTFAAGCPATFGAFADFPVAGGASPLFLLRAL